MLCAAYPQALSLARSFGLVKFSDSVRSSFSSPDVVDLGRGKREGEEKEQKERTDGRTMLPQREKRCWPTRLQSRKNWQLVAATVTYLI